MPSRILREGILKSDRVNLLTPHEEVFYRRLFSVADDYGCYDARPTILRVDLYPLKLETIREADILRWIAACEKADLIALYEHQNRRYVEIIRFRQRLRIKKRHWPEPPWGEKNQEDDGHMTVMRQADDGRMSARREEKRSETKGRESEKAQVDPGFGFPSLSEVKALAGLRGYPADQSEAFWNHFEASGWIDRNGHPIKRWEPKLANWVSTERAKPAERSHHAGSSGPPGKSLLDKEVDKLCREVEKL